MKVIHAKLKQKAATAILMRYFKQVHKLEYYCAFRQVNESMWCGLGHSLRLESEGYRELFHAHYPMKTLEKIDPRQFHQSDSFKLSAVLQYVVLLVACIHFLKLS